jgi:hypothetical protein
METSIFFNLFFLQSNSFVLSNNNKDNFKSRNLLSKYNFLFLFYNNYIVNKKKKKKVSPQAKIDTTLFLTLSRGSEEQIKFYCL